MSASYSVELQQAFIVGEEELKKLLRLLSEKVGAFEIRVDCADDIGRSFKTLPELVAFENAKGKEIKRLHISARSEDFSKQATIDFSGSRWRGISLQLHAREDVISRLRTEVLDIIGGTRPWYAMLHRFDFVSISLVTYILLYVSLLIVVAFKWIPVTQSKGENPSSTAAAQLVVYGGIVVLFVIGFLVNRFRDAIFRRAVFLIGQGKNRFEQTERFQWGVVIAFVVSFASGVVILIWQAIAK